MAAAANLVHVITPMPDNSANSRAEAALSRVQSTVIANSEDYVAAAAQLAEIKGQFKAVDKQREELKAPSLEACRRVDAFFKPPLNFLQQAETILKGKLTAYDREQERLRLEEQKRLDELARQERLKKEEAAREAERKAREAAEAARKEAEAKRQAEEKARREAEEAKARGDREAAAAAQKQAAAAAREAQRFDSKAERVEAAGQEKAAALQAQAAQVVAPVVQRASPKVAGLSYREMPEFEIEDKSKLPIQYLMPDETKIRKVVNALKMEADIPGVRVWMKKVPASGAT